MTEPPVKLVVLGPGKQLYGTRSLVAGDQFEMTREWADILIRLGKARLADEKPAPIAAKAEAVEPDLGALRAEASRLGILWDGRWGPVRLNHEIAQAKLK